MEQTLIYGLRERMLTVLYATVLDWRDAPQPQAKRIEQRPDKLVVLPVERPSFWHRAVEVEFDTLEELAGVLKVLEEQQTAYLVPGLLTDNARDAIENGAPILRRAISYPNAPATLSDQPKSFLIIDVDGAWMDASVNACVAPETAAEALRANCPQALRETRCVVQLSASTGIRAASVSGHIAFLLDRALTLDEQKRGLEALVDKEKLVNPEWRSTLDYSVLRPAQPLYTAAPLLLDGVEDPCPTRIVVLDGKECLTLDVPPLPEKERKRRRTRRTGAVSVVATPDSLKDVETTVAGMRALYKMRRRVTDAVKGSRHPTIRNQAFYGASLAAVGKISLDDLRKGLLDVARVVYGDDWGVRGRAVKTAIEWGIERGLEAPASEDEE